MTMTPAEIYRAAYISQIHFRHVDIMSENVLRCHDSSYTPPFDGYAYVTKDGADVKFTWVPSDAKFRTKLWKSDDQPCESLEEFLSLCQRYTELELFL